MTVPNQAPMRRDCARLAGAFVLALAFGTAASCGASAGAPCAPGPAKPFAVGDVVRALANVGIRVYRTPASAGGCARGVVAIVANVQSEGSHANLKEAGRIIRQYGNVSCEIDKRAAFPLRTRVFKYEGGARVVIDRANVECSLHPHAAGASASQKVHRLVSAISGL